jgi:hypothetical protein
MLTSSNKVQAKNKRQKGDNFWLMTSLKKECFNDIMICNDLKRIFNLLFIKDKRQIYLFFFGIH